jgi:NADH:ubiquinone reductase (H+-translocating)
VSSKRILVLGGGFAGLWSAVGAARKLVECASPAGAVEVTLINRDPFHSIRVRNYETDLTPIRVPLADVLEPIGVQLLTGTVSSIDFASQSVAYEGESGPKSIAYDRLVFAMGSQLVRPNIPGLAEYGFDVDTYAGAVKLQAHLQSLPTRPDNAGRFTVTIVGAGLTGVEAAAEMPDRLRTILAEHKLDASIRVILADHQPHIGSDMGDSARPVIVEALTALGVEMRTGVEVIAVNSGGLTLKSGEFIASSTVIWCAGMRANPLAQLFPVERDRLGRIPVDSFMRVRGVPNVFAAGDSAWSQMDAGHVSVMSCQHARPMGRFAGHNVVADLLGLRMLPLEISWYATILDLGPWGAVYTEGWDRQVVARGSVAKKTKQVINCQRIYPPLNRNREEILAAAAPIVQTPPPR